ncbi:MAG TPA: hypothetical protein VLS48_08245 [Anaerolineales bacterium]|nr:hypothetical protein [Anaerolineales bacterium]
MTALTGLTLLLITGCRAPGAGLERPTMASPSRIPATIATAAFTASPTLPPASPTPVFTPTRKPTSTSTLPVVPALRAQVLQRANCRYGPGAPYLYKYGLVAGSNMEAIGRNSAGSWLLIRAIGGDNPCWVKATLMEVQGEINSLALVETKLPQSPYYAPPKGASAVRTGDEVAVYWSKLNLRLGDDSGQYPYLIEAWLCLDGALVFTPVGVYETSAILVDEPGCAEPSHARLYGVEKHGYTRPVEIPWPTPGNNPGQKNMP